MREYIKLLLITLVVIVITGCGSNDKEDPITPTATTVTDGVTDINATENPDSGGLNPDDTNAIGSVAPINNTAVIDSADYIFINPTTPLEIVESNTTYELKVELIQNSFPVGGKTVHLRAFTNPNDIYGTFDTMTTSTDEKGYAVFQYKSPEDITSVNGRYITIEAVLQDDREVDENTTREDLVQRFTLHFNKTESAIVSVLPFVVVPNDSKNIELTTNSQEATINIKVFEGDTNAPYSEGNVKVTLPSKIVDGVDVGSFESYSVPIINGVAQFNYRGPQDLRGLIDSGDNGSIFQFYHEADPSTKQSMRVIYHPQTDYIPTNYTLELSSEDNKFIMGIPDIEKTFSIILKDDKGDNVDKTKIKSTTIQSQNTFVGHIMLEGAKVSGIISKYQNPITFNVKSNRVSGLVPIEINMNFIDANGVDRNISKTVNITVLSGPPTAMSISYIGAEQDSERAKYIEKFAITATDIYGNRVNTLPTIATGAIVGYAVDGSSATRNETPLSKRLYFGKYDINQQGTISRPDLSKPKAIFSLNNDGSERFQYVDEYNDKLVIFGEGYKYEALGKWDFNKLDNYTMELKDDYFGATRDKLFFAVGNNKRQDPCADDGREYVGYTIVDSEDSKLDSEGTATILFKYDYELMGKNIILWVNLGGYQADTNQKTRIGEARKVTLRGFSDTKNTIYSMPENGYEVRGKSKKYIRFNIVQTSSSVAYKNAHFIWDIQTGSTCRNYKVVGSSNRAFDLTYNDDNSLKDAVFSRYKDSRECVDNNNGEGYVDIYIDNSSSDDSCTFNIDKIMITSEF